jgi:site-specific DNA-methyltransferase (adenine-specific)
MLLMARYPDNYFDLAIVDPPYGIGEDGGKQIEWKSRPNSIGKKPKYEKKQWDNEIPKKEYFVELFRVSKNQIIWGGNYFTEYLKPSGKWIVWDKLIEIPMFTTCELAWTSFKGKTINRFKVHPFNKLNGGKDKQHPTQKPVLLYEWVLQNYVKENQKILDTHLGSGSIAIALNNVNQIEKMNLTLTACELDEDYYKSAVKRINEKTAQVTIF